MRAFALALVLAVAITAGAGAYLAHQRSELRGLCQGLKIGLSMAEVRELASQAGFHAAVAPGTQIHIEPAYWITSPAPQCLAVFNSSTQLLEQRFWQPR
jgi:hypothetical protein